MASEVMKVDEFWFPVSIAPKASRDLYLLDYGNGGTEEIEVMEDDFPLVTNLPMDVNPLQLVGHGVTDVSTLFVRVKFTAIGVYMDADVASHLQGWKGKSGAEILADDDFFDTLCGAPVEKFIGVVIIKELKGAQYGLNIEMKDRLAAIDEFEEDEKEGLEKLVEFFQGKYLNKKSLITFNFPASTKTVEVSFFPVGEKNKSAKTAVENGNIAAMIMKYYLGGSSAISRTTITTLAAGMAALLSQ